MGENRQWKNFQRDEGVAKKKRWRNGGGGFGKAGKAKNFVDNPGSNEVRSKQKRRERDHQIREIRSGNALEIYGVTHDRQSRASGFLKKEKISTKLISIKRAYTSVSTTDGL